MDPGLGVGLNGESMVAGIIPMGSSRAKPEETTWDPLPMGSPSVEGCSVSWVATKGRDLDGV